jgi:uncharacterized protein YndB with AHSA1/START domain
MTISETAVRREVVVDATIEWAFEVFTKRVGTWWPREHHVGQADMENVWFEPRVGGRCYEVGVDGSECDWGQVLAWEPPRRLVVAWQLNGQFEYDPDLSHASEYEVSFSEAGPGRTRVELEHRGFDRHGPEGDGIRRAVDDDAGWTYVMGLFAAAVASG